jgi:hypothetical protein
MRVKMPWVGKVGIGSAAGGVHLHPKDGEHCRCFDARSRSIMSSDVPVLGQQQGLADGSGDIQMSVNDGVPASRQFEASSPPFSTMMTGRRTSFVVWGVMVAAAASATPPSATPSRGLPE